MGTQTFALAGDGADLAAALQTTIENDDQALNAAIDATFPGPSIAIEETRGIFGLHMHQHGLLRPLPVSELSDAALLPLAAALMTPRTPPLVVLNEPETSLHPDLIAPLGRLIVKAWPTDPDALAGMTEDEWFAALEAWHADPTPGTQRSSALRPISPAIACPWTSCCGSRIASGSPDR